MQEAGGTCKEATIRVDTGKDKGRTFTEIVQPDQSRQLHEGEKVVVAYEPSAPRDLQYSVADVDRKFPMALLAGIFALAVVVVGRLRGVMALVALAVSFLVLTLFVLPAILQGSNPLLVAVVGASAIMLIALYMCHGLSARTSVAVLGTLVSLLLIGILGSEFIGWAALTGNTDDNTGLIHGLYPSIDMSGLLLAEAVIIGSLGVLDDVTVTQTSAVWELHEANPSMGWRGLYRAGMRIGRDHIASVVNTLVLAYARRRAPLAAAVLDRSEQCRDGGQQRTGGRGDRAHPGGFDRPGRPRYRSPPPSRPWWSRPTGPVRRRQRRQRARWRTTQRLRAGAGKGVRRRASPLT
ncbi:hypothetical protein SALBM311S_01140 [Streptomyces alboniger]